MAKARAVGDTNWASVDHVVEHDANIQPGNSGGALVSPDANVVGVDHAGGSSTNQSQFFAIANDIARPLVEPLTAGENVDSIGINGRAHLFEDGSSGIWVGGVTPGSPAGLTGVKPGDFVLELAGQTMADDGTTSGYCDVLRRQGIDKPISIEVLRIDTGELLEGELNGRAFEEVSGPVLTFEAPASWSDVYFGAIDDVYPQEVSASTLYDDFDSGWSTPGVSVAPSPEAASFY